MVPIMLLFPATSFGATQFTSPYKSVQPDKVWTIHFNRLVNPNSITLNTVYVLNASGNPLNNEVSVSSKDGSIVYVQPPQGGYVNSETYMLHIDKSIAANKDGMALKDHIEMPFTIEEMPLKSFIIGTWHTNYSGYSINITFNKDSTVDVDAGVIKSNGTYVLNGSSLSLTMLGRTVTGEVAKTSENKFTVTTKSGTVLTFNK